MKKMTICNAVVEALKLAGQPQTPQEIYDLIEKHGLYKFNSKTPLNVLKAEIRKHSEGIVLNEKAAVKYFKLTEENRVWIK